MTSSRYREVGSIRGSPVRISGVMALTIPDRDNHRGQREAVDDERHQGAALEIVHQEPHGEPAAEERDEDRDQDGARVADVLAGADEVQRLLHPRAGGDRDAQQERVARRRRAVEAGEEPGGDRNTRARRAGNEGECLRHADRDPLAPAHVLQRVVGPIVAGGAGAPRWRRRGRLAIGHQHHETPERRGARDQQRRAEVRLDVLAEEHAGDGAGNRREHDDHAEPAIERAAEHREDLVTEVGEERGQRAEVQGCVHREALVGPAEDARHEDQVTRGGNRQALGQALDEPQDQRLGVAHPTISSPPSTPITLPVIQYVSGCDSTTIAFATSSGVVRRPPGLRRRACAMISSLPGIFWSAGVLVTPARMELALMPRGPSSAALTLKKRASRPRPLISVVMRSTLGSVALRSRWTPKTFMPARARARLTASPKPEEAPRTRAQPSRRIAASPVTASSLASASTAS